MPRPVPDTRALHDDLSSLYLPVMLAVFGLVAGLIVFTALNRRRPRPPREREDLPKVEIALAVVLAGVAVGLITATIRTNEEILGEPAEASAEGLPVQVVGARWRWRFTYPTLGLSTTGGEPRPAVLTVPAGVPIDFALTSTDVVHSLYFPERRFKRDAFPEHVNRFRLAWEETGVHEGKCAEFCGTYHPEMNIEVRVLEPEAFALWVARSGGDVEPIP